MFVSKVTKFVHNSQNLCVYNLTLCVYKFSNFRYKHPAPKRYSGTGLTMRYLIQKRKAPLSTSPAEHHPPHEFQHKKTKRKIRTLPDGGTVTYQPWQRNAIQALAVRTFITQLQR